MEEACKFLQTVQTDKMRLVEITQNKIQGTVPANTNIDELDLFNKSYRIEVFYFLCILYDSNFQKQLFGDCLGNGAKQSIIVKRLWSPPPPPPPLISNYHPFWYSSFWNSAHPPVNDDLEIFLKELLLDDSHHPKTHLLNLLTTNVPII